MPAVLTKVQKQLSPIDRFIGEHTLVVKSVLEPISNAITAEWREVCLTEETALEDQGMLYLSASDDGAYSLQLCFMQYEEESPLNATICTILFSPTFFEQYPVDTLFASSPVRLDESTEHQFSICAQNQQFLRQLKLNDEPAPFLRSLQQNELALGILRRALECISIPFTVCQVPACRFLMYEREREKISDARAILDDHVSDTISIRELSRKVAMNECYLKKGFKALVGKTIHEYQQERRISKAKELLSAGNSVTDVANMLGYSSISHFSAAFKRMTGLKPCELLSFAG